MPRPRTSRLEVDAAVAADLTYPLFLRTPLSSWKLGGRISRVPNDRELVDGAWFFLEAGPGSCSGTAREAVFKHVARRLLGAALELRADAVGGAFGS